MYRRFWSLLSRRLSSSSWFFPMVFDAIPTHFIPQIWVFFDLQYLLKRMWSDFHFLGVDRHTETKKLRVLVLSRPATSMLSANQIFLDVERDYWNKKAKSISLEQTWSWHAHSQANLNILWLKHIWNRFVSDFPFFWM